MIEIYTDGSASGNGTNKSNGSFGVVIVENNKIINAYASPRINGVTNNRMEMEAILWALENYGNVLNPPKVHSDSSYAVNTFNIWMWGWKKNGWIKGDKKVPENLDLVKKYDIIITEKEKDIILVHVKGHSVNTFNNIADALATKRITPKEVIGKVYE